MNGYNVGDMVKRNCGSIGIIKEIRENQISSLKFLKMEKKTVIPEIPFPRYKYDEILELIEKKFNINIEWGEDITTEAYRKLGRELKEYYYINLLIGIIPKLLIGASIQKQHILSYSIR